MIGALQTNKARKAIELFDLIQSVDRFRLAEQMDRIAGEMGKTQRCLIEVKISAESTKTGVPLNEADDFVNAFSKFTHLQLCGFMTIGALNVSVPESRAGFRRFKDFSESHRDAVAGAMILSMGMSDDFEMAIEEGSTMVRLGRALFGERERA